MNSLFAITLLLVLHAQADPERIVCVPNADSSGWECGKGENAPAARPLPRQPRSEVASSPPPYLIDPARLPAVMGTGGYGPAPVSAAEEAGTRDSGLGTREEPAETPASAKLESATLEMGAATPAPSAPEPVPEPPSPPTVQGSEPAQTAPETDAKEPRGPSRGSRPSEPDAGASPEVRPTRSISSVARDAADLLGLPPEGYTVQLVASRSFAGYAELRSRLGVAVEDTFVIRVRRGSEDWWLMLWRDFPDLAAARAAAATLKGSYWPRRLAPLQAEVRATPD